MFALPKLRPELNEDDSSCMASALNLDFWKHKNECIKATGRWQIQSINVVLVTSGTMKTWYNEGTKGLAKSVCYNTVVLYQGSFKYFTIIYYWGKENHTKDLVVKRFVASRFHFDSITY